MRIVSLQGARVKKANLGGAAVCKSDNRRKWRVQRKIEVSS